jgi:tryptophan 2,3-dioxygenase
VREMKALMKKIRVLTNENVRNFAIFLANHYKLSHNLSSEFCKIYKEDKNSLEKLKDMIERQVKKESTVRRWAFEYLLSTVEVCIKRCNGVEGGLSRDM